MKMWQEMADDRFNNLVESIPQHIAAVIKPKGGSITIKERTSGKHLHYY
jgi:hypothetical protein